MREATLVVAGTGAPSVAAPTGEVDDLGAWTGNLRKTLITNTPMPVFDGLNSAPWDVRLTAGVKDAWLLVKWGKPPGP